MFITGLTLEVPTELLQLVSAGPATFFLGD